MAKHYSLKEPARLIKAAFGIMLLMIAFGCSKADPELVGTWTNAKAPEVVEFKKDGTGLFLYPNSQNPPLTFAWKQTSKDSYSLDVNYMGSKKVLVGTLKDKTFSIVSNVGTEVYNKQAAQ